MTFQTHILEWDLGEINFSDNIQEKASKRNKNLVILNSQSSRITEQGSEATSSTQPANKKATFMDKKSSLSEDGILVQKNAH